MSAATAIVEGVNLIDRLERALNGTKPQEVEWATHATPTQIAERIQELERSYHAVVLENIELRDAVKGQQPLTEVRVFNALQSGIGIVCAAWVLEDRGDKCHLAFKRDAENHIIGLALSVETSE